MGSGTSKTADLTKKLEGEKEKIEIYDGEVKRVSGLIEKDTSKTRS